MTAGGTCVAAVLAVSEMLVWTALVPDPLGTGAFATVNVAAVAMFAIGFASAAKELPALSIAQTLHELEHSAS